MREVAVITTGFFDGVHLGHRHVLETVVSSARERGEEAVVVTFWPHPRTVLQQDARLDPDCDPVGMRPVYLVRFCTHLYFRKRYMTQGILPTSSRQVQA